ncbi:branched-chain alpha-keto acid dehydrogenase subunit E2 [Virgibacillus profundi]|uniref:Dihydrolipoamide acetyltransferase component of pyruvate dehydrogenase complex n=1 Tax=Virgibacillus profundi TaxID=2024555 RepID=A0A2A2IIH8_9BACI|nr:dihydrolipoamide acetyltransferase family protein [Virgibacillus profundi]PAV30893.1 branched-chain alpha-keto acid dehydrogenase subunit E2 [Virgibacillus profundi]PXY55077.1 2-oxo acid dehydrogenase subunit E2 [Virgibacillus profundi]
MAKEVFMPKLSSTMEVGTLLQWLKEEGDSVEVGEPLFEIMTDKINIEVESYEDGVLLKKYNQVDDEVPVNAVIAYIGEENEEVPDEAPQGENQEDSGGDSDNDEEVTQVSTNKEETSEESDGKVRATPAARRVARENDLTLSSINGSGPKGRVHEKDVTTSLETKDGRLITPLAEKVAADNGLNLDEIQGTGSRGKITKSDVLGHVSSGTAESEEPERIKLKGLRKAVADKMLASARSIPHVTLTTDVDMTKVIEVRKALLPVIEEQTGYRLSYTEIIMKATAHVLGNHPTVNASLVDNEIVMNKSVNLGLAVAIDNGLIVPSVPAVQSQGLAELTVNSKTLGKKARNGKLTPDEMTGSTFTISNLGMYAIDGFTPIINPPETAILGVGRITEKAVVVDGSIEVKPMMVLSLSFDHRAIDGAPAAAFLTELKERLENPYGLLV